MTYTGNLTDLLNNAKKIVSSDPESSLKYVLEIYAELKDGNDYDSIGKLCKLIGTIYLKSGKFSKAKEYFCQAISNFTLTNNYKEIGDIYNNLVIVAYYLHTYDNVEEYSKLALQNYHKVGNSEGVVSITNNLAKYYRNIGAYDKAYTLLKQIIKDYAQSIDREAKTIMLANYGNVCINLGYIDEGFKLLTGLAREVEDNRDNHGIMIVNLYLTEYYESIGDYKNALNCHKKRHNSFVLDKQEDISSDLNNYLNNFNIDIDRLQYDRMIKKNDELVKAHNVVSKKNGFLETLINTIPLPLFYIDLNNYYLGCNKAFTDYFGVKKKDIIGKKIGVTQSNCNFEHNFEKARKLNESGKLARITTDIVKSNGETRSIEMFSSRFSDENGQSAGTLGMIKDITQDIEQQKQIIEINAHLRSVLESASQVYICSINRNYEYRYFNTNYAKASEKYYGVKIHKGYSYFAKYKNEATISEKRSILKRVFAGEVVSGVLEYTEINPKEIVQYFYSPIIAEDGQIIGATFFSYDITERVSAQRALALSNKTKDKFFSIIAHDLRSHIGNIKSALEFLTTEQSLSSEDIMDMLEQLSHSAINTYDLLENLLQWSLTQRGLIKNNSISYQLNELIEKTIRIAKNIANNKNIKIEVTCSPEIQVFVDKNMFFTTLRNLITNAIKYSYNNSIIKVVVESDDKFALVKVIDYGVGIKPEVIPYLKQMEKTVTTYGTAGEIGSGLGLVLCHELVAKLGGTLWIESEEKKGSTFSFTVPVQESN